MAEYRAFLIKNNQVDIDAKIINADTDLDAIKKAEQLVDGDDVELWAGARFVRGFKSKDADDGTKETPRSKKLP